MLPFSKHCASIGFSLKNIRWSWVADSSDGSRLIFSVWNDEISQRRCIIYLVTQRQPGQITDTTKELLGASEARRLAEIAATDSKIRTYGIECFADNTICPKRTRKSFDWKILQRLRIEKDNCALLVATILGSVLLSAEAQLNH